MRVYLANHSSVDIGYLQGKYGRCGWLLTPEGFKTCKLRSYLPYAFDNGAFSAYQNKTEWDEGAWVSMVEEINKKKLKPEWILAPDVVGDAQETLKMFFAYRYLIQDHPVFFAVQDGMNVRDVPCTANGIFVGGSLPWKIKTLSMWANAFPRVHVGRVNRLNRLISCSEHHKVESIDGTGWFRRPPEEWVGDLTYFFEGKHKNQFKLFNEINN